MGGPAMEHKKVASIHICCDAEDNGRGREQ